MEKNLYIIYLFIFMSWVLLCGSKQSQIYYVALISPFSCLISKYCFLKQLTKSHSSLVLGT